MRMRAAMVALGLCLLAVTAWAMGPKAVRERVESSLLVKGTVHIDPEGRVERYQLDDKQHLPPVVDRVMARIVAQWRFEPVKHQGKPVSATAPMSIRLAAKRAENGDYQVRLASASFGSPDDRDGVRKKRLTPPRYPKNALLSGVGGSVYVVAKVRRDGAVEDVFAEQVNLRVVTSEQKQVYWREILARAALGEARNWRFEPPTEGPDADAPYWTVRVPVDFYAPDTYPPRPGTWEAYVPGPRKPAPWLDARDIALGSDALAGGAVHTVGTGLRLLTPLSEG